MAQLGVGRVERRPPVLLAAEAPLQFACQGCGAFCCTNERLILSPLELRRVVRTLGIAAVDLSTQGWLAAFPDPETGLPRVAVEFLPVKPGLTACPFLLLDGSADLTTEGGASSPLAVLVAGQDGTRRALAAAGEDGGRGLPLRCGAYAGRPIMCRSFPLQFKLDLRPDGAPAGWSTVAHTRCPGHGLGAATQTAGDYVAASGIAPLAEARLAWHRLNLAIAAVGVVLQDHAAASGSRRALWDATLNLLFASDTRPRLQVPDSAYTPTIQALFEQHLTPVAGLMDAEQRVAAGTLSRADARVQLQTLVAACQALEAALDEPAAEEEVLARPAPVA